MKCDGAAPVRVCPVQSEEIDAMLQRLSGLGAVSEKQAVEYLKQVARLCMQVTESIKSEVRRTKGSAFTDKTSAGTCVCVCASVYLQI